MIAWIALILAILALVAIVIHALVPFPPAHTADPWGLRTGNVAITPMPVVGVPAPA